MILHYIAIIPLCAETQNQKLIFGILILCLGLIVE